MNKILVLYFFFFFSSINNKPHQKDESTMPADKNPIFNLKTNRSYKTKKGQTYKTNGSKYRKTKRNDLL